MRRSTPPPPPPPPLLLLLLLLLLAITVSSQTSPCLDEVGNLHTNGTNYYDYPDAERRCNIYSCINNRAVLLRDCQSLTGSLTATCTGYNGRRYYAGQSWWETTQSPCHQYICLGGRKTVQNTVTCPPTSPRCRTQDVFGQCCPSDIDCGLQSTCRASSGQTISEGQTWWETPQSPCKQYICRAGRPVPLNSVACQPLDTLCRPQSAYGQCCPTCASSTCRSGSGRVHYEGDTWWETARKPCKRYRCRAGLKTMEQTISCPTPNPGCQTVQAYGQCCPTQTQCGCLDRESTPPRDRANGEQWPSTSDPCVTKICSDGQISEQRRLPQPQPCPPPPGPGCAGVPAAPGVCACPTYRCETGERPCFSDGVPRPHGSQWQIDPCTVGTCHDGQVHRAIVDCAPLPAGCKPRRQPSVCCPACDVTQTGQPCEFDGTTYQHNDTWGDDCSAHVCDDGNVISQYRKCPAAPKPSCAPVQQDDSCCVRWSCDNTKYWGHCSAGGQGMLCYQPGPQEGPCTSTNHKLAGGCCTIFDCLEGCLDEKNALHPHGSTWQVGCTIYSCNNGKITSAVLDCARPVDEHCRRTNPDECCPRHDCDCEVGGRRREDGEHWTADCREQWCKSGHLESRLAPCPGPPRPDCVAQPPAAGRCCAEYSCSCAAVLCQAPPAEPGCLPVSTSSDGCCTIYSCAGDCQDEEGRVHRDGTEWYVKCSKYRCSGGTIREVYEPCPPSPRDACKPRYLRPEDCCPVYDCPDAPCTPGESTFDGCNHCSCLPPGVLVCTLRFCEETGCTHYSGYHRHGESWTEPVAPCVNYTCHYGTILSTVTQCPPAPGPLCAAAPVDGECCPRWDCDTSPCPANFTDVTWEDDCNVCTCNSAGVVCTEHVCPKQCLVDGTTYETGDTIIGDSRCERYTCVDGVPISALEECRKPPDFSCTELPAASDDCCPAWACRAVPGFAAPCDTGQIYHGDTECVYCECVPLDGGPTALCSKMDCTDASCSDEQGHHEHGSVWVTPNPCKRRACTSGTITELEVKCHPAPADNCRPLYDDSRCCPTYHCGDTCQEGETWTRDCNSCFCRDGLPVCTQRQCPDCTEGDTWQVDCNNCTCIGGRPVCTEKACGGGGCVDGTVWQVECNTCLCIDGQPACTKKGCTADESNCPAFTGPLVASELHPVGACSTADRCAGTGVGCCRGRCSTLSNKSGTCPADEGSTACVDQPGYTCFDDHQCPGAYKCCQLGGCSSFCVAQSGDVIVPP